MTPPSDSVQLINPTPPIHHDEPPDTDDHLPPVRSLLFVPADRPERMAKALATRADAVVFDMESAIARTSATKARHAVRQALQDWHDDQPFVFVRTSSPALASFADDLESCLHPATTALMLPQVTEPKQVVAADEAVQGTDILLMPLVESAQAVRLAYELATASPRVAYMGGATSHQGDLSRSVGFVWSSEGSETLYLRQKVLADVRAAGVHNPLSGLWGIIDDLEGLTRFAAHTRQLGYEGMLAIHPSHVPIINEAFSPTADEVLGWRRIIAGMEAAEASGVGSIRLEGRIIDRAHAETARAQLARASRLGLA